MESSSGVPVRVRLRNLLRLSRFQGWDVDRLEDEIAKLFSGGVNVEPVTTPDQLVEPSQA